eukprot:TRINITY_DN112982_c0_g1_i1.p1 TRINITY_DN112982_c0_g1~~TRINITY_DN112982_c0_g1_i1.p1  ORF type:complete len:339 (+),score=21.63 TRINITY_DN112982_c0_g1_i1:101-1018(+)
MTSSVWARLVDFNCLTCCDSAEPVESEAGNLVHQAAPTYAYDESFPLVIHPRTNSSIIHAAPAQNEDTKASPRIGEQRRYADFVTEDGMSYKGQVKGSMFHGRGALQRGDGSSYVGEFANGSAHGSGRYIHPDGSTYEGDWIDDEKTGNGVEVYADGSVYKGRFENGIKRGDGSYTSPSGALLFQGQMLSDKMHGEGVYAFSDGRRFHGQWKFGHMSGQGIMDFPDGSRYCGEMVKDSRTGEGVFTFKSGKVFRGQWLDGKLHGKCAVEADGQKLEGTWMNGVFIADARGQNILQREKQRSAGKV